MLIGAYDPMSCPNPCASSGCFAVYSAGTVVASVMIGLLLAHGGSLHIKADDPRRRGIARWDGRMSPVRQLRVTCDTILDHLESLTHSIPTMQTSYARRVLCTPGAEA